jgi:hypothetical protein
MLLGGYLEDYAAYVLKKSLVSTPFNWIKVWGGSARGSVRQCDSEWQCAAVCAVVRRCAVVHTAARTAAHYATLLHTAVRTAADCRTAAYCAALLHTAALPHTAARTDTHLNPIIFRMDTSGFNIYIWLTVF